MNGILLIDKPAGLTSHAVVAWLRKILDIKRIGHAGTLDPAATGLLVILVGSATKLFPYLSDLDKEYEGEVTIGVSTDTLDAEGNITAVKEVEGEIAADEALISLLGEREQAPPMFSAIKSAGKKLYELARKGIEIERRPRAIAVYDLKRISPVVYENGRARFSFYTRVSKGTYIRTLSAEIGEKLGFPAHLSALRRLSVGSFSVREASGLEEVSAGNFSLLKMLSAFPEDRVVRPAEEVVLKARAGRPLAIEETGSAAAAIAIASGGELVAVYKLKNGRYYPERVWN
ncbi:MAG TPA: tRNA pseudouridine(55) synthase TruB [Bacilli bacterium]|nr:tRNA pseudouridine(55) synthase TruB [Bacilli bacterium]HPZ27500.1 tRNA pseudouridine(55) synthase TruB [Bacilli bacterium]HQC89779.1 tRNA pseudouridine(55) synthase TruB [Bacilli bacterium]